MVNFIKYNKVAYSIYFKLASFFIRVLSIFVKSDDKLILFNSYAGRKLDDSPKAIYDVMRMDPRFTDYRFVWAFHQPDKFVVEGADKIKTDGLSYFITALAARVWITNSSVERGLSFKRKNTLYINTWHGSPIKKMGSDIVKDNKAFKSKGKNHVDIMNTQSYFEANVFSKCFGIPRDHFIEVGLPRNDILANYKEEDCRELKRKLALDENKRIILYCPTYREYEKDRNGGVVLVPPMDLVRWKADLGDKYILLIRAHYEVSKLMDINENSFIRNVTDYPSLNDLMIVSDILISDYSSVFFDYSIMDKCMLHFSYDYDKYEEKRGMYFDIRSYISGADNEDDLIGILNNLNYENEIQKTVSFRNEYMNFYGNASKRTVDCIAKHIIEEKNA